MNVNKTVLEILAKHNIADGDSKFYLLGVLHTLFDAIASGKLQQVFIEHAFTNLGELDGSELPILNDLLSDFYSEIEKVCNDLEGV
jgi:hypothetical protein